MARNAVAAHDRTRMDRRRGLIKVAVIPVALLLSSALVWQASYSAFSGTTDSPGNEWSTASVELQNDTTGTMAISGTLMFNPTGIVPGDSGSWCVNVKNAGDVAASMDHPIKFITTTSDLDDNDLAGAINLEVVQGTSATGGDTGDCTGFTAGATIFDDSLSALPTSYASASTQTGTTSLASGATASYQLTWSLPESADNALQGESTGTVALAWTMEMGS